MFVVKYFPLGMLKVKKDTLSDFLYFVFIYYSYIEWYQNVMIS